MMEHRPGGVSTLAAERTIEHPQGDTQPQPRSKGTQNDRCTQRDTRQKGPDLLLFSLGRISFAYRLRNMQLRLRKVYPKAWDK